MKWVPNDSKMHQRIPEADQLTSQVPAQPTASFVRLQRERRYGWVRDFHRCIRGSGVSSPAAIARRRGGGRREAGWLCTADAAIIDRTHSLPTTLTTIPLVFSSCYSSPFKLLLINIVPDSAPPALGSATAIELRILSKSPPTSHYAPRHLGSRCRTSHRLRIIDPRIDICAHTNRLLPATSLTHTQVVSSSQPMFRLLTTLHFLPLLGPLALNPSRSWIYPAPSTSQSRDPIQYDPGSLPSPAQLARISLLLLFSLHLAPANASFLSTPSDIFTADFPSPSSSDYESRSSLPRILAVSPPPSPRQPCPCFLF
ncbi:hypothetical protein C8R45DRAFT_1180901 [Mycena sanguinolenta]|nr:hypothetical protein C8R45DRAFT_1180901 [Mycena sanguinolenta]